MNEYRSLNKYLKKDKKITNNYLRIFLYKLLICILLFLCFLISIRMNPSLKNIIYDKVYNDNLSFAYFNNIYKKYLGNIFPMDNLFSKEELVFNEKLSYDSYNKFKGGVLLNVSTNYLVPVIEEGVVVFIGNKKDYGDTVIIEQANGIKVWYANINVKELNIYDYVEKGSFIGEVKGNSLYMVFQKDEEYLDYKKYI